MDGGQPPEAFLAFPSDFRLFPNHAKAGARHVAEHPVGTPFQVGLERGCVGQPCFDDVQAQPFRSGTDTFQFVAVQVARNDMPAIAHLFRDVTGFAAGRAAQVNHQLAGAGGKRVHTNDACAVLYRHLAAFKYRQRSHVPAIA